MTNQQNGHHPQGREAPPVPTYTFPNGVVARLHAVSQFTIAHVEIAARKRFPPPDPPMNTVNPMGAGERLEPNYSDPQYEADMKRYRMVISYKIFDAIIDLAADVEIDQGALDRVTRTLDAVGTPLEEISDKVAYIKHCCIFDLESEMPRFQEAIRALTAPREEDVADHIATFPSELPRA